MKINNTYFDTSRNIVVRVIFETAYFLYFISLDKKKSLDIFEISRRHFEEFLDDGTWFLCADPFSNRNEFEKVKAASEKIIKKGKKRLAVAEEFWDSYHWSIMAKSERKEVFGLMAEKTGWTTKTCKKLMSDFLKGGGGLRSVIPDYRKTGKSEKKYKKRPGPLPGGNRDPLPVSRYEKLFNKYYRKYYLNSKEKTKQEVYDRMISECFVGTDGKIRKDAPSIHTFRRWCTKQNGKKEIEARESTRKYNISHRNLERTEDGTVNGPLEIVEIDATPLDCHLIHERERDRLIGRPSLYIAIDVYSRLIVGYNISLKPNSWEQELICIANIPQDKIPILQKNKVPMKEEWSWPGENLIPQIILSDRGEALAKAADKLVQLYHIEIRNQPAYRGDLKGIVERFFRTINSQLKSNLPGAVKMDHRVRGEPDYRKEARLDINQLERIVLTSIMVHNNSPVSKFVKDKDQMEDMVAPIPVELWNYAMRRHLDSARMVDPGEFEIDTRPVIESVAMERGRINYEGMVYVPTSENLAWAEQEHLKSNKRFDILVNEKNPETIFVISGEGLKEFELIEKQQGMEYPLEVYGALNSAENRKELEEIRTLNMGVLYQVMDQENEKARILREEAEIEKNDLNNVKKNRESQAHILDERESPLIITPKAPESPGGFNEDYWDDMDESIY